MNGNIETGHGREGNEDFNPITPEEPREGKLDLQQRVEDLEKQTKDISDSFKERLKDINKNFQDLEKNFEKLEGRIDKTNNFMMWVMSIAVGVFVVSGILIILDYFVNNEERYEKFVDKTIEIQNNNYSKQEIDKFFNNYLNEINKINENSEDFKDFKKCLQLSGWSKCF